MRKNRICLNAVSRKIPDSLSEDRLMFSSAGAQPISLKSFRGLGFPNKIARVYKHEHCLLPCVVLKSFCIEYSAKGAVKLAVSIAAGAGVLLPSMAVLWLFFRKDPMAADRHGAHHCECGPHRQQHRGICPASGAGFFLRCADGLSEHSAVTDHAASDAQPGCRVGLCMSLKTTNRKQEIR